MTIKSKRHLNEVFILSRFIPFITIYNIPSVHKVGSQHISKKNKSLSFLRNYMCLHEILLYINNYNSHLCILYYYFLPKRNRIANLVQKEMNR